MKIPPDETDFGFTRVSPEEKNTRVNEVFSTVASRYDIMNDVMSLGLHRLWKRSAVAWLNLRRGEKVLDVACGSGDLTQLMIPKVGEEGLVVSLDRNIAMIKAGYDKLLDSGRGDKAHWLVGDAEHLPFPDNCFDAITISFGLRNVTHKVLALAEFYRLLSPRGRLIILEFSEVVIPALKPLYDAYSMHVIPAVGEKITGSRESYQYLVESIRMHPSQAVLTTMLEEAQFSRVQCRNMLFGVVAMHRGYKC